MYNSEAKVKDLETVSYLSRREMKIMEEDVIEEDIVDIQSQTMTHTWCLTIITLLTSGILGIFIFG